MLKTFSDPKNVKEEMQEVALGVLRIDFYVDVVYAASNKGILVSTTLPSLENSLPTIHSVQLAPNQ